jgi:hypothetical protein
MVVGWRQPLQLPRDKAFPINALFRKSFCQEVRQILVAIAFEFTHR